MTAEQLGITPAQYEALIWTRNALDPSIPDTDLPSWLVFEMESWGSLDTDKKLANQDGFKCGSACCIGGTMEMHMAGMITKSADYVPTRADEIRSIEIDNQLCESTVLRPLFFRYMAEDRAYKTRTGAVAAIDRFLAGNTSNPWLVETKTKN